MLSTHVSFVALQLCAPSEMTRTVGVLLALVLVIFAPIAYSLECFSCDNFLACTNPFPVKCPTHAKCYTLWKNGELHTKGCAHSCESLAFKENSHCTTCHHRDFCNGPEIGIGQGVVMKHHSPEIGLGVNPNSQYQIGHGVRPRSAGQHTLGVVMSLPIFARILL